MGPADAGPLPRPPLVLPSVLPSIVVFLFPSSPSSRLASSLGRQATDVSPAASVFLVGGGAIRKESGRPRCWHYIWRFFLLAVARRPLGTQWIHAVATFER